jgi:hypothetical protein
VRKTRVFLSAAAAATAAVAFAAPAQAVDDGTYNIRDVNTGACVTAAGPVGGELVPCSDDTAWTVRNVGDGSFQLVEPGGDGRCLGLSPIAIFPPFVGLNPCGAAPDRWAALPPVAGPPVALTLADARGLGFLTAEGGRAHLGSDNPRPQWVLQPAG